MEAFAAKPRSRRAKTALPSGLQTGFARSRNTTEKVFELLLEAILTFELKPHDELSEGRLAEQMGVSRTPIREALAKLAGLRLVEIFPQRGSVISPLRASDLVRSQFLRESLEIGLVRRAIRSSGRAVLVEKLRQEIRVQETFVSIGDESRFYKSDEQLHQKIADSVGLPNIWQDIADTKLHMDRFRHLTLASVEQLPIILEQHKAIVDAIQRADEQAAEDMMKRHLRRIFAFADRSYALHPEYFEDGWSTASFVELFDD